MPSGASNPGLGGKFDVQRVDETESTNADVLELARQGAPEGTVVVADHQTAGRGRLGRTWEAPPGASLLLTVLLRPAATRVDTVTMVVAMAMADAVEATTGVRPLLKWPNDLLVDDRKLAGILAEADWRPGAEVGAAVAVAVGIGVNCNWPPAEEWPEELVPTLASLNHVTGAPVDRDDLLTHFLRHLDARYGADTRDLRADARSRSATLGRTVRVDAGNRIVEGRAVDINEAGHLVVELADGSRRTFTVGDVTHLRHASPPGGS